MKLIYKIEKGIGILQNPQQIDISMCKAMEFEIPEAKNSILELNKMTKISLDDNGIGCVSIKMLKKGTNTIRVIKNISNEHDIYPCQPFVIFDYNDKLYSSLATSLDVLEIINKLQDKCIELEKRLKDIEKNNPESTKNKVNELIEVVNDIQYRLTELEKGYDPTI